MFGNAISLFRSCVHAYARRKLGRAADRKEKESLLIWTICVHCVVHNMRRVRYSYQYLFCYHREHRY